MQCYKFISLIGTSWSNFVDRKSNSASFGQPTAATFDSILLVQRIVYVIRIWWIDKSVCLVHDRRWSGNSM